MASDDSESVTSESTSTSTESDNDDYLMGGVGVAKILVCHLEKLVRIGII